MDIPNYIRKEPESLTVSQMLDVFHWFRNTWDEYMKAMREYEQLCKYLETHGDLPEQEWWEKTCELSHAERNVELKHKEYNRARWEFSGTDLWDEYREWKRNENEWLRKWGK